MIKEVLFETIPTPHTCAHVRVCVRTHAHTHIYMRTLKNYMLGNN
jgi:hypothetical protein